MESCKHYQAIIIGGGPAGLMAAEQLSSAGMAVAVFDAMPSVGRKFLRAGIGGLNITHSDDHGTFLQRFGERQSNIAPLFNVFNADAIRLWCSELGVDTFIGSSGRVFPREMKAAPLLRKWLRRLRSAGVQFHTRHRWCGWDDNGHHRFESPRGELIVRADALVFALGGASWSALGSDGQWAPEFEKQGIACAGFRPANCGFEYPWPLAFREQMGGQALKNIGLRVSGSDPSWSNKGDAMLTEYGVEGSLIYAASSHIRDEIDAKGKCKVVWDLLPDTALADLKSKTAKQKSTDSASNLLRKLGVKDGKLALLKALTSKQQMQDIQSLPKLLKKLPQTFQHYRPIDEAISTAGGLAFDALDATLMLRKMPGVFCAGEMLDWEAPTGGYLLTACFASGVVAGRGAVDYLNSQ